MENQTQTQMEYDGVETPIDAIQQEIDQQRKDAQKNSRFRQIDDGKTAQLTFTGRCYKRTSSGTDEKGVAYSSPKLDWELIDTVPEGKDAGKNKVFSVGAKNKINKEILVNIKAGRLTMLISRKGEGKSTKYEVTTPE